VGRRDNRSGVEAIGTLTRLEELRLRAAKITDAGTEKLTALKLLRIADLSETQLSSSGMKALARIHTLEQVSLYNCKRIDDAALGILSELPQLRWLDVKGTQVTGAAVAQLKERRPKLTIVWEPAS
jgi:Leucine-rich repeat (LRR) protein